MPPDMPAQDLAPPRYRLLPHRREAAAERRRLARDLAQATEQQRFLLHFQPRASLVTGQAVGAEAVLRWPHRRQGLLAQAVLVPLAEQHGLMPTIGAWALRSACAAARRWPPARTVALRLAPCQLAATLLLDQVGAALEESGLPAERLELGLPEAALPVSDAELLLALSALRDLGVGLALDAFGAAHASLTLLRRLPLTALKLDRALFRHLPGDREDAAILRSAAAAARALGLTIIADGVETQAQRAFLAASGCDQGQGDLFGAALPAGRLCDRCGG